MPSRISKNLYKTGNADLGWEVLKRLIGYTDYFPYFSQNPRTDRPFQDLTSMPLEVSAGGGMEAIIYGVFGIHPLIDGSIIINPPYNSSLGISEIKDFDFRGHKYGVKMLPQYYEIYKDNIKVLEEYYGKEHSCK